MPGPAGGSTDRSVGRPFDPEARPRIPADAEPDCSGRALLWAGRDPLGESYWERPARLRCGSFGAGARSTWQLGPGVSTWVVSQIERGHLGTLSLDTVERVAAVLQIHVQVVARWRGGDLGRLVNARHSALHEIVAQLLSSIPGWAFVPEVSFSEYGERGIIDIFAWHAASRTLLVIELKTEIVEVQETVGTLDRKRRLAAKIGAARGWRPAAVAAWLIVAESSANRRRVAAHRTMLRAAFPNDGREMRRWLLSPVGAPVALSFLADVGGGNATQNFAARKRVRLPRRPEPTLTDRS